MEKLEAPRQLSSQAITELKQALSNDPHLVELACSRLAIEAVEELNGIDLKKSFSYGLVVEVGVLAVGYSQDVQNALNMGGDGWPEDAKVSPDRLDQMVDVYLSRDRNA